MTSQELEGLIIRALQSDFGIWVESLEVSALRPKLYEARKSLVAKAVPDVETVTIRTSPRNPGGELWLVPTLTEAERELLEPV